MNIGVWSYPMPAIMVLKMCPVYSGKLLSLHLLSCFCFRVVAYDGAYALNDSDEEARAAIKQVEEQDAEEELLKAAILASEREQQQQQQEQLLLLQNCGVAAEVEGTEQAPQLPAADVDVGAVEDCGKEPLANGLGGAGRSRPQRGGRGKKKDTTTAAAAAGGGGGGEAAANGRKSRTPVPPPTPPPATEAAAGEGGGAGNRGSKGKGKVEAAIAADILSGNAYMLVYKLRGWHQPTAASASAANSAGVGEPDTSDLSQLPEGVQQLVGQLVEEYEASCRGYAERKQEAEERVTSRQQVREWRSGW
jgi:hypothetical protein